MTIHRISSDCMGDHAGFQVPRMIESRSTYHSEHAYHGCRTYIGQNRSPLILRCNSMSREHFRTLHHDVLSPSRADIEDLEQ